MAEMARDTYGDKTLIELNTEIELLQNDLALLRDEYAKHNARITGQITRLRHIINDRQQAIDQFHSSGPRTALLQRASWITTWTAGEPPLCVGVAGNPLV